MKHVNLMAQLTFRDALMRIALVLSVVTLIVWFMPRETHHNFKVELGKPWRYADLTAPFNFVVYKSEAQQKVLRDSLLRDFEPYYIMNKTIGPTKLREFLQNYNKEVAALADYKSIIANRLRNLYDVGIVDTKSPMPELPDSVFSIRVVYEKNATSEVIADLYTAKEAYEELINDPAFDNHHALISELNLNDYIVPNVLFDRERSEASKQDLISGMPIANGVAQRGQKIIDRGAIVDEQKYLVIQSFLMESERRSQADSQLTTTIIGEFIYVLLLMTGFTLFLSIFRSDYFEQLRSVGMIYALIMLFSIFASLMVSHNLLHVYFIPFAMVPIFIRVFMDSRTAFMAHVVLVLICACVLQYPLEFIAVESTAGLVAILSLRDLSSRSQLFWTAAVVTFASCLMNLSVDLITTTSLTSIDLSDYNYLIVCGIELFCSYPLLYIMEKTFGYTSNITLIELSDMNKEPLRSMSEVAPGTFQHSIQVGNLAAEIARKIGAKTQLVRTGAMYHDIGKIQNPIYFTENQSGGINPHEQLSDIDSAGMIISHVTEGLKLADKYNLPESIKAFISTHHGQGKAKFFYVKYKNEHPDEDVDELLFTYPGPNPFTKEQAILMMADSVEAASRSLPDYTEHSIRQLVNRVIDGQLADGFFRECPITFRDIQYAKTVLIEKLKTIYHTRISYPELKK
jgi:putative nucleotidyltransferase with HDIG domain